MEDNEGLGFISRHYLLLQGFRLLPIGVFSLVVASVYGLLWSWVGGWSPWFEIVVFLSAYSAFWYVEERCEESYGRSLGDQAGGPPTAKARLLLAAVLTICLVVGSLAGSPLGGVELVVAGWLLGYQHQGGQLWKHYRSFAWALAAMGVVTILGTLSDVQTPSPWFLAMTGMVIVFCCLVDQRLLNRNVEPIPENGDDD